MRLTGSRARRRALGCGDNGLERLRRRYPTAPPASRHPHTAPGQIGALGAIAALDAWA